MVKRILKLTRINFVKKFQGFTLIELLVAISIIAILSTIGISVFRGAATKAQDTKRKADVDAISKVLEMKYDPVEETYLFSSLVDGDFSSGLKPKDPITGQDYQITMGENNKSFIVCTTLSTDSSYCRSSAFGTIATTAPAPTSSITSTPNPTPTSSAPSPTNTPIPSPTPTPNTLISGLVGYWKMENGSWADDSGNGNNGIGGCTGLGCTNTTITSGKYGNAGDFSGDDFVNMGAGSTLDIIGPFTISAWYRIDTFQPYGSVVSKGATTTTLPYYGLNYYASNQAVTFYAQAGSGISATTNQNIGPWYHVVGVHKPDHSLELWIDGVLNNTGTATAFPIATSEPLYFGQWRTGYEFDGQIDEVRLYNRALSESEISTLYNWVPSP